MKKIISAAALFVLAACEESSTTTPAETADPAAGAPAATASVDADADMAMTPEDLGGFTQDGFTFHTRPGSKHVVRLEAPGTDTWKPKTTGEPAVKLLGERKETTPEGKAALVFDFEAMQSGNAEIVFERLEDGEVEASRTVRFMVH